MVKSREHYAAFSMMRDDRRGGNKNAVQHMESELDDQPCFFLTVESSKTCFESNDNLSAEGMRRLRDCLIGQKYSGAYHPYTITILSDLAFESDKIKQIHDVETLWHEVVT